jgi:hypothetical protein
MAIVRAFEITNLVLNDETADAADKYLIVSDNVEKDMVVPKNAGEFMNIYIGKEHDYSCETAYNELVQ